MRHFWCAKTVIAICLYSYAPNLSHFFCYYHLSPDKSALKKENINVIDFPYFESRGISAEGCYLNFLETEKHIFLPVFGVPEDKEAIKAAERIFTKKTIPVEIKEIAKDGGCLNCISWEE